MTDSPNLSPNAVTAFPDDLLLYEPAGTPHVVEMSLPDGRVHRTITGTALTTGDDARGPDAGTIPENEYDTGTERYVIGVRNIGPPARALDQIAPFVSVGSGLTVSDQRYSVSQGVMLSNITPVHANQQVGVFLNLGIVAFGEVRSIQFQITYTGIPADPSWEPPVRA
jgi:hypothetical protein